MTNLDDTQPNPIIYPPPPQNDIPAPPRFLLLGVLGLFVLGIVGTIAGVYVFRDVLPPSQQQRVINNLPFMEALLPRGEALPTAPPVDAQALDSLLNAPLNTGGTPTVEAPAVVVETTPEVTSETVSAETTPEVTEEAVTEPEEVVAVAPTDIPPTQTPLPTLTPTVAPTTPPVSQQSAVENTAGTISSRPVSHINGGIRWEQQDWNNCGPANITMALSYYGWTRDQSYAQRYLKPEDEDKNVSPDEMVAFVNDETDLNAIYRFGGDLDVLRDLIANGFPVIVETGYWPEGNDWLGHYQTVAGYDDSQRTFFVYDSFIGATTADGIIVEDYQEFDRNWQNFNRVFIVLYEPSREAFVMDLLGTRADPVQAAQHAFEVAQTEARANPNNTFAFFNMGISLSRLGRYDEAALAFDRANQLNFPYRMLWYQFDLFETYFNVGRLDDVMAYVNSNLSNGGQWVEETYYWQGRVLEAEGSTAQAVSAFRTALQRNNNFEDARQALDRLG